MGLRIDGETSVSVMRTALILYDSCKHIPGAFWPGFCGAAGVFCIGEVYGSDIGYKDAFLRLRSTDRCTASLRASKRKNGWMRS